MINTQQTMKILLTVVDSFVSKKTEKKKEIWLTESVKEEPVEINSRIKYLATKYQDFLSSNTALRSRRFQLTMSLPNSPQL